MRLLGLTTLACCLAVSGARISNLEIKKMSVNESQKTQLEYIQSLFSHLKRTTGTS